MTTGLDEAVVPLIEPIAEDDEPRVPEVSLLAHVASTPDIVGFEVLDAHAIVKQAGLRLAVSVWETKVGPWGMILSQQPDAGEPLHAGGRIHAVVAGRPHLVIPDVQGMELRAALEALRRLGLQPVVAETRLSRTVSAGQVISTRPGAGSLVVDGSRVMVKVARPDRRAADVRERAGS